ncbi:MAG: AAA family ATPase [Planctomycetales bacterium]
MTAGILPVNPNGIPAELKARPQWVLWRSVVRQSRPTKQPFQVNGQLAESDNPATWNTFDAVLAVYQRGGWSGIGFVFSADDDFVGVDFDGCRNPENGEIDWWAVEALSEFPSYAEISPTGTGVKAFVRGSLPTEKTGAKTGVHNQPPGLGYGGKKPGIEAYQRGRFFAVTGHHLDGAPEDVAEFNGTLHDWFGRVFTPKPAPEGTAPTRPTSTPTPDRGKIIERAKTYLTKFPVAVSGERGHDRLFRAACVCRCEFGLSLEESLDALTDWNAGCTPPWSDVELRHKLEDAGKEPVTLGLLNAPRRATYEYDPQTGGGRRIDLREHEIENGARDQQRDRQPGEDPLDPEHGGEQPIVIKTVGEISRERPTLRDVVISGLLRKGETMSIVASPKTGKSWLAANLLLSIASGRPWLGMPVAKGTVLLIDNELHPESIAHRIRSVADALNIPTTEYEDNLLVLSLRGRLMNATALFELLKRLKLAERKLMFALIDARYRLFVEPGESENDNAATTRLMNLFDGMAEYLDCAVGNIHHATKGSQGEKEVTDVGSGAGSANRAVDAHIVLRPHDEHGVGVLEAAVRSFPPFAPIGLRWVFPVWNPDDAIDTELLKGRRSSPQEKREENNETAEQEILDLLKPTADKWRSANWINERVTFGHERARAARSRLVKADRLEEKGGKYRGRKIRLFRLPTNGSTDGSTNAVD